MFRRWIIALWAAIVIAQLVRCTPFTRPKSDSEPIPVITLNSIVTPTATATRVQPTMPLQTPAPTSVTEVPMAVVMVRALNVRQGPGMEYAIIAQVRAGDRLTVLGRSQDNAWLAVYTPEDFLGWVAAAYVQLETALERLPNAPASLTARSALAVISPTAIPSPTPTATPVPPASPASQPVGWHAEYFNNLTLDGIPALTRVDPSIDFDWGQGTPAGGLVPADNFSVRWTRSVDLAAGAYRFIVNADDGVRLWLDNVLVIDQWHDASHAYYDVVMSEVTAGQHTLRVEYYERGGTALLKVNWQRLEAYADWEGQYFTNPSLSGMPMLVRSDRQIDFNWGHGSPHAALPADNFSVHWTRTANFEAGAYRFGVQVDDGVRLWVDGQLLIDAWHDASLTTYQATQVLTSGTHSLRVDYYDHGGEASVRVGWERVSDTPMPTFTPMPTATTPPSPTSVPPTATATPPATPTPTAIPPTATPSPTPTLPPTETPTPAPTLTPTPMPTETPVPTETPTPLPTATPTPGSSPTETATPTPLPPAGTDSLTAQVFIDPQCDGFFQQGVDIPVEEAAVTLSFPNGARTMRQTTSFGMVSFAGFDASGGVIVSLELPESYRGYALRSCFNSPASIELQPDDFQFGQATVQFGVVVSGEIAGQ